MIRRGLFFLTLFVLAFSLTAFAQSGHKQVAEGNKLYHEEKYDAANNEYRDALIESPESPVIHYNIGDALYKKRNYEEALKAYEKATNSDDILMQARSYYNMGNTLYKMGKLPESIMAYKRALELNPNDEDAKYNLEYVRAKLKEQANKQPQQNQQQQQQQQQDQGNSANQDQKEQQKEQENQKQDQAQQNREQKQQQEQKEAQQQQAQEKQDISKEDAERILNALKNEEQDLLEQQKAQKVQGAFRGKDW